jgi:hypothetical protein
LLLQFQIIGVLIKSPKQSLGDLLFLLRFLLFLLLLFLFSFSFLSADHELIKSPKQSLGDLLFLLRLLLLFLILFLLSPSGINSGHHYLPTYQILMILDNVEFLPPIFYAVFWQPFWKWQTSQKFWKRRFAPLMVTYHYVKFYCSIIIQLEVININVRNLNFPIGFYSNPHPLWTPQNKTLTPFTTKLSSSSRDLQWTSLCAKERKEKEKNYDVLNWFLTSTNFYRSPFSKWLPQYRTNSTLFDFKGSFWFIF